MLRQARASSRSLSTHDAQGVFANAGPRGAPRTSVASLKKGRTRYEGESSRSTGPASFAISTETVGSFHLSTARSSISPAELSSSHANDSSISVFSSTRAPISTFVNPVSLMNSRLTLPLLCVRILRTAITTIAAFSGSSDGKRLNRNRCLKYDAARLMPFRENFDTWSSANVRIRSSAGLSAMIISRSKDVFSSPLIRLRLEGSATNIRARRCDKYVRYVSASRRSTISRSRFQ